MKFDVEKCTTIDAPMDKVYALVADFKQWNSWSPWTVIEPSCIVNVSGNANQAGHSMSWQGEVIGAGKNTLVSSSGEQLHYNLEFFKPWKSKANVSFHFEKQGELCKVTWRMNSSMPFFLFFMVKTMKNLIVMDYDRGLLMLKTIAEKGELNCQTSNNGIVDYTGFSYVGIQRSVAFADMPTAMKQDFDKLVKDIVLDANKGAMHWLCIYPKFDIKTMHVTYIAAVSDEDLGDLQLDSSYQKGTIANTKALEIKHHGSYKFLGNAWSMGMMYMRSQKSAKSFPFEQYWNNPMEVAPEELKTSIFFPVKG